MSEKIDDRGPAFPEKQIAGDQWWRGMSLRDYFAAHALAGMWAAPGISIKGYEKKSQSIPYRVMAIEAYAQADAMLAARKQPRAE